MLIYCLAGVGGFVIMSLELLGGRVLAPFFGNDVYIWGSLISVFMLALAIGYLLGGRWSVHDPSIAKFASVFLVAAVLMYPLVYFAEPLMDWASYRIDDPRYGSLSAAVVMFGLPTIVLGIISPYSVRLLVETTQHSGEVAGRLYFVSTLGSALGTLMTSFYFVLWFEINTILTLLSGTLVAMSAIGFIANRMDNR